MSEQNAPKKESGKGNGIGLKFLVCSASIVVLLAGLKAAQSLLAPFFLAVFFALVLMPPLRGLNNGLKKIRWIDEKGLSGLFAILALSLIVVLFGLGVVGIFSSSLTSFAKRLPHYQEKLTSTLQNADDWVEDLRKKFEFMEDSFKESVSFIPSPNDDFDSSASLTDPDPPAKDDRQTGMDSGPSLHALPDDVPQDSQSKEAVDATESFSLRSMVRLDSLMKFVHGGVMELMNIATASFLIAVMVIFMLIEASRLPEKIRAAFKGRDLSNEYFDRIAEDTWKYTKIKTIVSLLTGLATTIGLWFLGVEYALLWGLLMFFLNYIPNIGPIIASLPPILLAFVDQGFVMAGAVTVWLIFVNFVFGYGVEPRYLGEGLGLSDLVVLLSLIFWGWLIGPIGMFLSAPLTMVLKIVLQNDPNTQWIATLISNHAPNDPANDISVQNNIQEQC